MAEWIGALAAVFTAASFVPQALKMLWTRETAGVSLSTYLLSAAGSSLWVAFGLSIGSLSVIACNVTIGLLAAAIATLKIVNGGTSDA
jgi:MtN3 and saliva related transmembrane protein